MLDLQSGGLNDKARTEGMKLEYLITTVHGLHQLISQPTHQMPQSSSWIDLIFTDQPNFIVDSGVIHPYILIAIFRLHMYCKLTPNIKYPPPYKHLVWDYNKANVESIKNIESVNWELMFSNKSVLKQVSIFNETLMNIFSNFTPNKLVTCDDRDPPWMNDFVKSKIKWKNQLYNT